MQDEEKGMQDEEKGMKELIRLFLGALLAA